MEYVWYTDATGFSLWKRFQEDGQQKERPIYNQQQQAKWFTKEVRSDNKQEELSEDFLNCLTQLRNEINAAQEKRPDEAEAIARYRKELHHDLDVKETKVVSEILMYYSRSDLEPIPEMKELLNYAAENTNLDLTDLEPEQEGDTSGE